MMALFERSPVSETAGEQTHPHNQSPENETHVNMNGHLDVLLQTTRQVNDQLQIVQRLWPQCSGMLSSSEEEWIDQTIAHAGVAILNTSYLTEPSPTQQAVRRSWVSELSFSQRMKRLDRDVSQVLAQISQLSITAQSLNTAMKILVSCDRQGGGSTILVTSDYRTSSKDPVSEELSEFMNRRRRTFSGSSPNAFEPVRPTPPPPTKEERRPVSHITGYSYNNTSPTQHNSNIAQDHQLVLVIEAVEKWRQTAEQALQKATQELCAGGQLLSSLQPKLSVVCHARQPIISTPAHAVNGTDLPSTKKSDEFLMSGGLAASEEGSPLAGPPSLVFSTITSEYNQERQPTVRRKPLASRALDDNYHPQISPSESPHTPHTPHFGKPMIIDIRQSFDKEAVEQENEETAQLKRSRQSLGISPDAFLSSHFISAPYHSFDNHSSISLSTIESQSQPYQISRGRAWLEWKAESLQ